MKPWDESVLPMRYDYSFARDCMSAALRLDLNYNVTIVVWKLRSLLLYRERHMIWSRLEVWISAAEAEKKLCREFASVGV